MREFWLHSNGMITGHEGCEGAGMWCKPRRVVVIDPDDRKAVERLDSLIDAHLYGPDTPRWHGPADVLQAALRDFAEPTPTGPTDPKARIVDRRENIWRLLADGDWVCVDGPDAGEYLGWQGLTERGPLTSETPDA